MHNEAIIAMEDRLRTAMLESDAPVLDMLLADELIFTNHLGQIMTKQNDLDAHRAGFVKIKSIDPSEQRIKSQGDLAIVSMLSRILGEFGGAPAEVPLRFTRIWQKTERGRWQVTAAHSCVVV